MTHNISHKIKGNNASRVDIDKVETQDRYLEGSTNLFDEIHMILNGLGPYAEPQTTSDGRAGTIAFLNNYKTAQSRRIR